MCLGGGIGCVVGWDKVSRSGTEWGKTACIKNKTYLITNSLV